MAGCASCGGCCAHCATTCGVMGGASFGTMGSPFIGGFGSFGFFPFFGGHHASRRNDDNATPVDGDALVDPNHPGHREAIKTISHVGPRYLHRPAANSLVSMLENAKRESRRGRTMTAGN